MSNKIATFPNPNLLGTNGDYFRRRCHRTLDDQFPDSPPLATFDRSTRSEIRDRTTACRCGMSRGVVGRVEGGAYLRPAIGPARSGEGTGGQLAADMPDR